MKYNYENEDKILQLFQEGYNSVQIAEKLNKPKCYYRTVLRVLKKNELKPRNNRLKLNEKNIENICTMYKAGMTQIEILKFFPVILCEKTINDILKRNNISLRRVGHKEVIENHNYFEVINTEEKSYFLGLLMADGCITKDYNKEYNVVSLGLKSQDKYLIEHFIKQLGFTGKPYIQSKEQKSKSTFESSDGFFTISFLDRIMTEHLNKLGIVPNKTGQETLPKLSGDMMPHFLRGFFDGDGSVFISNDKYLRVALYSSEKMCKDILDLLNLNDRKIYPTQGVYFISFQKRDIVENFYHYIYDNCTIYMKRKKDKFDSFFNK